MHILQNSSFRRLRTIAGAAVFATTALLVALSLAPKAAVATAATARKDNALAHRLAIDADSLDVALASLDSAAQAYTIDTTHDSLTFARVTKAYGVSRMHYKHMEAVVEFYAPAMAAALNSRRQEVDDDDAPPPASLTPGGFPALESLLFPMPPKLDASRLDTLVRGMRRVVRQVRSFGAALAPSDAQIIELSRLEITRVLTLSIAGFDTPVTHAAAVESADALEGVRRVLADVGVARWPALHVQREHVDSVLHAASSSLAQQRDFDTFDRLDFIVRFGTPASHALDDVRVASRAEPVSMKRGWRANAASVYDSGAFDARAYAADNAPTPTPELIALGRRLFSEPVLSGNGSRSCASCHLPSHAFTDGIPRQRTSSGHGLIARHTPTLLNAALSPAQFADERAITIEEQIKRVVESPTEMAGSLETASQRLRARPEYVNAFMHAFPASSDGYTVNESRIRFALAAYVRSLETMNSRFDRAVRGDTSAISAQERSGFNLFMGKAGCGTCHFAPLFNGNTPPLYLSADVEVIGTPRSPSSPAVTDADSGRAGIDRIPLHLRAFKTPTVRNAARTAPFMHNGAFRSLDEVLRFYDGGGANGAGGNVSNQTLGAQHLELTAAERAAIIAFIGALTDSVPR